MKQASRLNDGIENKFNFSSSKLYVVGTQMKCLNEMHLIQTFHLSTHNIYGHPREKPNFVACEQQRSRPACASAVCLCYSL